MLLYIKLHVVCVLHGLGEVLMHACTYACIHKCIASYVRVCVHVNTSTYQYLSTSYVLTWRDLMMNHL